eukprot:SM000151S01502  [mRNA]  locus=s151:120064:120764:- [translate_table: standard]
MVAHSTLTPSGWRSSRPAVAARASCIRAFPEAALATLRITAKGLAFEAGEALGVGAAERDDAVVVLWTDGGGFPRASVAGSEAAEATATAWLHAEPWAQFLWEQSARRKLAGLGTFDY